MRINNNIKQSLTCCLVSLYVICFNFLLFNITCHAEDFSFKASVDKTQVFLGSSLQLNLSFYGTKNIPALELPDIKDFDCKYLGPSTKTSIVNGQIYSSISHFYTLIPLKIGQFEIPSFSIKYKNQNYNTQAISIKVIDKSISSFKNNLQQAAPNKTDQGINDKIFLIIEPKTKKAYVNEIIPLKIKLYINNLVIRDIQLPKFSHSGFLIDDFAQSKQYREVLEGVVYNVVEFNTNIFGTYPGILQLGPAKLDCNLILRKRSKKRFNSAINDNFFGSDIFEDFFGGTERYPLSLESIKVPITIINLPDKGKPSNFSGALGIYDFDFQASPKNVKVGDPITIKIEISGEGNFKTINMPTFEVEENFKFYEPEIKNDSGKKIFEQVIIPKHSKITEIPKINFSFFNTQTGQYHTLTKGPIPITVDPLTKKEELKFFTGSGKDSEIIREKENFGRDIIYIKESLDKLQKRGKFLCTNKFFIFLQILPLLLIIIIFIFQKRKDRLNNDLRYARRLKAKQKANKKLISAKKLLVSGNYTEFFNLTFKILQRYLSDKLYLPSASITYNIIKEKFILRNLDISLMLKIKKCFSYCDLARYAPANITEEQAQKTFQLLNEIINNLEKIKL